MNIYDLPIANFGELEDEAALKLILEVRLRRRLQSPRSEKVKHKESATAPRRKPKEKNFNSPFGNLTREQMLELMASLKSSD